MMDMRIAHDPNTEGGETFQGTHADTRRGGAASVNPAINTSTTRRNEMLKKFRSMLKDEKGQALAEYGLILALIAVACIIALGALSGGIQATLGGITAAL